MVDTNKLKSAMVKAGFSQNTFAKELGMSINTLNAKINGKAKISTDEAKNMCDVLGIHAQKEKVEIFLN